MYLGHFSMTRYPFEASIAADSLFAGAALKEAEARIRHVVERRGIGLLTGEPGCGKTSVLRRVAGQLHPGRHKLVYAALTTGTVLDSCNLIGAELGCPPANSRYQAWTGIRTRVSRLLKESRQLPVLIVDEAHLLRTEVIEELRLLTNFEMDSENRLCLLLAGHSTLRRRLAMAVFESLTQRLAMQHRMNGLGRDETGPYVEARLELAGAPADLPLFEPAAIEALHLSSNGIPRQINRIAHYALVAAAGDKVHMATAEHVMQGAMETTAQAGKP